MCPLYTLHRTRNEIVNHNALYHNVLWVLRYDKKEEIEEEEEEEDKQGGDDDMENPNLCMDEFSCVEMKPCINPITRQ